MSIEITGLTKRFGTKTAVNELTLNVRAGELYAFLGPNGAGKTTTLKTVAGLLRPTSGTVHVGGFDLNAQAMDARQILSYVPEQPFLYDKLSGREFLFFVGRMYGIGRAECRDRIDELSRRFATSDYLDELAEGYSHGMRQRVVISAALLHDPKVLVIDEPMVGLDPRSARLVKDVLREQAKAGKAVLVSTHTLSIAEEVADRIGIIHHGRLIAEGTVDEVRLLGHTNGRLEDVFLALTDEGDGR